MTDLVIMSDIGEMPDLENEIRRRRVWSADGDSLISQDIDLIDDDDDDDFEGDEDGEFLRSLFMSEKLILSDFHCRSGMPVTINARRQPIARSRSMSIL
jgi:hypothetical protein